MTMFEHMQLNCCQIPSSVTGEAEFLRLLFNKEASCQAQAGKSPAKSGISAKNKEKAGNKREVFPLVV
ncbi:hypothetical protein [Paenibacillus sp. URB8-2]|uniref:hypothetical protein n=1 Tax=Paenibacillus sp. URB8-2 TaxID=2741301 RepID=UPI0015BF0AD3|nr:hypothetical protein [Paenibacillus sp. URB8-2]